MNKGELYKRKPLECNRAVLKMHVLETKKD